MRPNLLLGQRFLVSRQVLRKIVEAANLTKNDTVLEIGPGTGVLTRALAEKAGLVIAVEKDRRLFEFLNEQLKKEGVKNVKLINTDILKLLTFNFKLKTPYKVVANIPYYLTSRLIRKLLETRPPPEKVVLTVQREVAERIAARPPRMNLLGLAVQAYAKPKILARIPPAAFSPPPEVKSALIEITDISDDFFTKNGIKPDKFFALTKAAFAGKRKLLINSLAKTLGGKNLARALVKKSGLAETARPEELSLDDWVRLAKDAD